MDSKKDWRDYRLYVLIEDGLAVMSKLLGITDGAWWNCWHQGIRNPERLDKHGDGCVVKRWGLHLLFSFIVTNRCKPKNAIELTRCICIIRFSCRIFEAFRGTSPFRPKRQGEWDGFEEGRHCSGQRSKGCEKCWGELARCGCEWCLSRSFGFFWDLAKRLDFL